MRPFFAPIADVAGEVIVDRDDIYGDGANVAARLESLAEPGGICISDAVRTSVGKKLDLQYEFMGEQVVKNISEPVRAYKVLLGCGETSERTSPKKATLDLPDRPSIAVLPFTNMSGNPEQEYFADGMTDDLITDLSKISGLFIIARNSTFVRLTSAGSFPVRKDKRVRPPESHQGSISSKP